MALTIAKAAGASSVTPVNGASFKVVPLRLTGDASYTTGGFTLTPSSLGLSRIMHVIGGPATAGTHFVVFDDSTGKLKAFTAAGVEVAAAASTATLVFPVVVLGL